MQEKYFTSENLHGDFFSDEIYMKLTIKNSFLQVHNSKFQVQNLLSKFHLFIFSILAENTGMVLNNFNNCATRLYTLILVPNTSSQSYIFKSSTPCFFHEQCCPTSQPNHTASFPLMDSAVSFFNTCNSKLHNHTDIILVHKQELQKNNTQQFYGKIKSY